MYIYTHGEEEFRKREHEVLCEVAGRSGQIIATGGGIVTRPENRDPLRMNSVVVFLRRDIAKLPTKGRPLSQKTTPAVLYEQRKHLYQSFADASVDNDGTRGETLTQILNLLEVL